MAKIIKDMMRNMAPGEDGMLTELFKGMNHEELRDWVFCLNELWKKGGMVERWKMARVFPIFKSGLDKDVRNYRGIALLNVGYKILVGVIARRLKEWLERKKKL